MLRSLMFDFAQDEAVKERKEEFMYGPSYLVCPVTDRWSMVRNAPDCNIRKGGNLSSQRCRLVCRRNDQYFEGGQKLCMEAGVDTMPVFVRAGS